LPIIGARADVEQSITDHLYGASTGTVEVTQRKGPR
jgi:hypothetical protein